MQAGARRFLAVIHYKRIRARIIQIQCAFRIYKAIKLTDFIRFSNATRIQTMVRRVQGFLWVEANRERLVKENQSRMARRASLFRKEQANFAAEAEKMKAEMDAMRKEKEEMEKKKAEMAAAHDHIEARKKSLLEKQEAHAAAMAKFEALGKGDGGGSGSGEERLRNVLQRAKESAGIDVEQSFALFDKDGGGTADKAEFKEGLTALGIEGLTEADVDELIGVLDKDGDGEVSLAELRAFMRAGGPAMGSIAE